jgi:serine/threonine-protein kinase
MGAPVEVGQVIKGKYRVDRVLGAGGMGVVVEAHHVALEQRFAIKFLLPAMLAHPEIVERFAREARAASRLESDHVARVVDVDALEDGTPFMVMEFLEGNDLSVVRREKRPLPPHVAVRYMLEACEALVEAHGAGIVHRDLKPSSVPSEKRGGGLVVFSTARASATSRRSRSARELRLLAPYIACADSRELIQCDEGPIA